MVNIDLRLGNCLDILKELLENSIDCVVTDPPYELGFMGKAWDNTGIAYNIALWKEVLRVLKPGGHLLSFGGSRTYHRMACAIEDAGFEIRDQIMWVYGSGFPKSLNIGKAVDKLNGIEITELPTLPMQEATEVGSISKNRRCAVCGKAISSGNPCQCDRSYKAQNDWSGWGTALKPAHEPIVLARKPLSEKTIAENVLKWGVGGINIDGCRVEIPKNDKGGFRKGDYTFNCEATSYKMRKDGDAYRKDQHAQGRFPANFIHDGSQEVLELFPNTKSGLLAKGHKRGETSVNYTTGGGIVQKDYGNDSGSAARFFYCAKASKSERGTDNKHPTVKPLALMKYLIKLVSREGQTVLDPFMGSGTTGIAAKELNRSFVGIEMNSEYMEIAKRRINA